MRDLTEKDLIVATIVGLGSSFGGWYLLHDLSGAIVTGLVAFLLVIFCEVLYVAGILASLLCFVILVTNFDPNLDRGIAIGFFSGLLYVISYSLIELNTRIKEDLKNDGFFDDE